MSDANAIAGVRTCVCKYCGCSYPSRRKTRKCTACKDRRPSTRKPQIRDRTGSYRRMTPDQRKRANALKSEWRRRCRKADPEFRRALNAANSKRRQRNALAEGRIFVARKAIAQRSFDQRQSELAAANAVQAWQYWLKHKATDHWMRDYWDASGQPWKNPRLSDAEKYRVQYALDPAFHQREYDRLQAKKRRHRAEIRSAGGLSVGGMARLRRSAARCHYCGCELTEGKRTLDHVVSLSRGGSNDRSNLVGACVSCNSAKQDKAPEQWMAA